MHLNLAKLLAVWPVAPIAPLAQCSSLITTPVPTHTGPPPRSIRWLLCSNNLGAVLVGLEPTLTLTPSPFPPTHHPCALPLPSLTRPPLRSNLYDVFVAIRDDEIEHTKTMHACGEGSILIDLEVRLGKGVVMGFGWKLGVDLTGDEKAIKIINDLTTNPGAQKAEGIVGAESRGWVREWPALCAVENWGAC